MNVIDGEAEIPFPCEWNYKIIGEDKTKIQEVVFDLIQKEYRLEDSKASAKGKYLSFNLYVLVETREEMVEIFGQLKHHPHVKMVI